jgi:hypothetical protein
MNRIGMNRIGLVALVVATLGVSGCGGTQQPRTAEALHTAWTTALASGEQTTAQHLVAADAAGPVAFVDRALDSVRTFTLDETRTPAGDDRLHYGISFWHSGTDQRCFQTTVQIIDGSWRVVEWYLLKDDTPDCERTP